MVSQYIRTRQQSGARTRVLQRETHTKLWTIFTVSICVLLSVFLSTTVHAAIDTARKTLRVESDTKNIQAVGYLAMWTDTMSQQASEAVSKEDFVMARRIWLSLAEAGNADAKYRLGMLYDIGPKGVEQDASVAAHWYQKAAEAGHLNAQHNLAVAYANGDGVELDIDKALAWWKRAAQMGNSDSQYNLGVIYAMGMHGVRKNLDMAKKWWRMAAMKGDPMAQYNLGTIYANGDGIVRSYCEAMRWWKKAAQHGVKQASWALEMIQTRQDYMACW